MSYGTEGDSGSGRSRRQRTAAVLSDPINTGYVPIYLQNATGRKLVIGDVVAVDYTNSTAFNGSAAEAGGIILTWMVAVANIPSGAVGAFGALGVMYAKITLNSGAPVAPGTWLGKDLTTGSLSLHSLGLSLASNNQPAPPSALAYLAESATITTAGVYRVYFPGGPRSDWPSATWFEFFEDFLVGTNTGETSGSPGGVWGQWLHPWFRSGDVSTPPTPPGTTGGIISLSQNAIAEPPFIYSVNDEFTVSFDPFVDPTDVMMEIRCAQSGSGAGTRRYGLWDSTPGTGSPTNGIVLTHTAGGNMFLRVFSGGSGTSLDSGFPQADGAFATWRVQHDSVVGAFLLFRNGVYLGRVIEAVPLFPLGPGFHASAATAWAYIDFIRVRSRR